MIVIAGQIEIIIEVAVSMTIADHVVIIRQIVTVQEVREIMTDVMTTQEVQEIMTDVMMTQEVREEMIVHMITHVIERLIITIEDMITLVREELMTILAREQRRELTALTVTLLTVIM